MNQGYSVGLVVYENFMPFKKAELDFSTPGLTNVEGVMRCDSMPGCNGNGSGKSALLDGIAWCLYDRCVRQNYRGNDVIHKGADWARVEVNLVGGENQIKIEHYQKHSQFANMIRVYVDGEEVTRGTNIATLEFIEDLIGMTFQSFCYAVAFGGSDDVKSFFVANDSDRKAVLERMLGLEIYARAEVEARRRLKEFSQKIDKSSTEESGMVAKLTALQESISMAEATDHEEAQMQAATARLNARKASVAVKRLKTSYEAAKAKHKAIQLQLKAKLDAYQKEKAKYDMAKAKLEKELVSLTAEANAANGVSVSLLQKGKSVAALSGGKCPTCTRSMTTAQAKEAVAALHKEASAQTHKYNCVMMEADIKRKTIDDLSMPTPPDEIAERSVYADVVKAEMEMNHATSELKHIQALANEKTENANRAQETLQAAQADYAAMDQQLQAHREKDKELHQMVYLLEFCVQGFGNRGLKSYLIESEVPELNKRATIQARRLFGHGATIELKATTELKGGGVREKMTVEGSIPGFTDKYAGASNGQKKRLDLALMLGFKDIVASRSAKAFKQLFVDEVFDGLDQAGCDSVVALLRDIAKDVPVFLISHDPKLKAAGDRNITCFHNGDSAVIIPSGSQIPKESVNEKRTGQGKQLRKSSMPRPVRVAGG